MKNTSNTEIKSKHAIGLQNSKSERGFTLVEATIALTILIIVLLGVVVAITFSIKYNHGNSLRTQSLAVLQQEVELYRSAKFTPTVTDTILLGGNKTDRTVTVTNNTKYLVQAKVDDDPDTVGTQTNTAKTLKEITVTVTPITGESSWINAAPAMVVFRRVKAN